MHLDTVFASIKECLELLVNFMNKIFIHKTFKTNMLINYINYRQNLCKSALRYQAEL